MKASLYLSVFLLLISSACNQNEEHSDAYGNFEAIEVLVSSESAGRIEVFRAEEGDALEKNMVTVVIDSTQLHLKKIQLESVKNSLSTKILTLDAQVGASRIQLGNLERENQRIRKLLEGGAATSKQQDDIQGQIALLEAQILATESQKSSIYAERKTLEVQISQVEDQIQRCSIQNPVQGILLSKYKEEGEIAAPGQPLYKVANLDELLLRAYVSGDQLSSVRLGGEVRVRYDGPEGVEETNGVVSWISPRAEFTPKIIQTREERVNLVYALKIKVNNQGSLKIGMPGEVIF
jgi:HlyD family secretion protein